MQKPYVPADFWDDRLSNEVSILTVGRSRLGYVYNYWLYQARFRTLRRILDKPEFNLEQAAIMEFGVGSGAYIPIWKKKASRLVGLDITSASVERLSQRYREFEF